MKTYIQYIIDGIETDTLFCLETKNTIPKDKNNLLYNQVLEEIENQKAEIVVKKP